MNEHRIRLPGGRTLAAAEVGDPDGTPLFLFHGFPGSRLGVQLAHEEAQRQGVRLIALDRPGWGQSDPLRGRRLHDWPADLTAAADRLHCDRFNVLGLSGGAPFSLASAAAVPDRIGRVGVLCGLGPVAAMRKGDGMIWHNRLGLKLASRARWLVGPALIVAAPLLRHLSGFAIDNLTRHSGAADRAALSDPWVRQVFGREFREGFRSGAGAAVDARIYGAAWDLDFAAIVPPVFLWHGEADTIVPVSMARWVADKIPDVHPTYYPGEGHFSVVLNHLPEIVEVMRVRPA
ncbi:MAG: alpha/beta fold hydrolase [Acidobacteria bacterium]|nr:alpha/beta fold hydrolase [Acidobacteriota bacterium]NIM63391.1 alpha/beta fold hydrolase [Acidobacteriota bacterium]NIO60435.1 alpha/beta fold hydrolase [Acidobacteriota bacterium]NIQ31530.1 alpha/beta fold hydrolase [Acidobacteriota bacterium]NIQ86766.1 alpha/beta fold hydrolase [Acidobacteriota bacterium]